jgi:hypothetical protein
LSETEDKGHKDSDSQPRTNKGMICEQKSDGIGPQP